VERAFPFSGFSNTQSPDWKRGGREYVFPSPYTHTRARAGVRLRSLPIFRRAERTSIEMCQKHWRNEVPTVAPLSRFLSRFNISLSPSKSPIYRQGPQ